MGKYLERLFSSRQEFIERIGPTLTDNGFVLKVDCWPAVMWYKNRGTAQKIRVGFPHFDPYSTSITVVLMKDARFPIKIKYTEFPVESVEEIITCINTLKGGWYNYQVIRE